MNTEMSLSSVQYSQIRLLLLQSECDLSKLEKLKTDFKEDINSQRVFERINSFTYLFKILEKRGTIGLKKIDTLIYIVREVVPDNMEIRNILYRREDNEHPNRIDEQRVLPPVPPNTILRINEMIKSSIGIKWKELARALSIQEGKIDNLEYCYRQEGIPRMVDEILTFHQEKCGRNVERWRSELQNALVRARRRDLSENIDDILTFNPIHAY